MFIQKKKMHEDTKVAGKMHPPYSPFADKWSAASFFNEFFKFILSLSLAFSLFFFLFFLRAAAAARLIRMRVAFNLGTLILFFSNFFKNYLSYERIVNIFVTLKFVKVKT